MENFNNAFDQIILRITFMIIGYNWAMRRKERKAYEASPEYQQDLIRERVLKDLRERRRVV